MSQFFFCVVLWLRIVKKKMAMCIFFLLKVYMQTNDIKIISQCCKIKEKNKPAISENLNYCTTKSKIKIHIFPFWIIFHSRFYLHLLQFYLYLKCFLKIPIWLIKYYALVPKPKTKENVNAQEKKNTAFHFAKVCLFDLWHYRLLFKMSARFVFVNFPELETFLFL